MDNKQYLEELRLLGEEVQQLEEKNCPTNPSKWSYYKSQAKQKFDVYPSAYANGWASKQYKAAGGGWKQCAGESMENTNENFAVHMMVAKAIADQKVKNPETKKDVRVTTALKDKQHPAHGKAKSLVQRLKDKFSKKENIEEGMVAPKNGHAYYKLTKDTPIKYVSGHSGIGLEVPGVLLHNEYSTIKGKKGAYIINYFGAHFYVDMKNKFASRIANPQNREQNKDLMKNVERVFSAPEHSDWKKYMNESVNEGKPSLSNTQDKQFASAIEKVVGGKVITRKHPRGGGSIFSLGNSDIVVFVQKVVGNKAFGEPSKFAVLIEDKFGKEYAKEFASDANGALKLVVKLAKKFKNKLTESASVNEGVINELSADTYKNTVKAALQRGDSKGNSIAVKALQSFGKAIAKELAGKSFEVAGARGINLAKGFYRGDSKKFINQFQMTFTGEGNFIESRNVKVFGSDEAHFYMKVEFQVPNNMGGWSSDVKFKGYEKYKFPGSIQFSIKQGKVWAWYRAADTELEFTRAGAREMAKLADIIVTAMDFPTKAKHNTIKQFDPMKVSNESVNESDVKKKVNRRGDVDGLLVKHNGEEYEIVYSGDFDMGGAVQPYGIVMPGDDVVSFLGKDKKAKSIWKQLKPKVDKFLKSNESVNEAASRTAMEIGGLTGMNKDAIQKFVDDNKLDIEKVYQYVKNGKLPERMALVSAIAGKPGNAVQTKLIKKFK